MTQTIAVTATKLAISGARRESAMPMRSWVSAIGWTALVLAGCAAARPLAQGRAATGTGLLKLAIAGRPASVKVRLAPGEIDPENDHVVTPLGTRGSFLLLTDRYASRAQTLSRCQAGHETWVRLIETRSRLERWSKLAESCLHNIEPGSPVATWGDGTGFTVNLISEASVRVSVSRDGRVVASK